MMLLTSRVAVASLLALAVAGAVASPQGSEAAKSRKSSAIEGRSALPAPGKDRDASEGVVSVPLRNPGFEDPPEPVRNCPTGWFCTMHADPKSFSFDVASHPNGTQYLRVTRQTAEPWAFGRQVVPLVLTPGDRLRLSMRVNTGLTEGEAGPKIVLHDLHGRDPKAVAKLSRQKAGWQRLVAEVEVGADARRVEVGFLIEGGGTTLFDDVRLELLPKDLRTRQ